MRGNAIQFSRCAASLQQQQQQQQQQQLNSDYL